MNREARQYDAFLLSRSEAARSVLTMENLAARNRWRFVLFGGAARDIALFGADAAPRDLDIVVDNVTLDDLQAEFGFRDKTGLGGLKGFIGNTPVDVWPLASTWGFRSLDLGRAPTFEDLMVTTTFNLEAIALEPNVSTVIYEGGFRDCIATKTLELNYAPSAATFVPLTLVRAASFAKRFGLSFGPKLTAFARKNYAKQAKKLAATQLSYFGREMLTGEELASFLSPSTAPAP